MSEATVQTNSPEFIELISHLKALYEPLELPHILLAQKLGQYNAVVKITELMELARESFMALLTGKDDFNPNDSRCYIESFRSDVLHATTGLQRKLVALFRDGKNKEAYMLLILEDDVRWGQRSKSMEELLKDKEQHFS